MFALVVTLLLSISLVQPAWAHNAGHNILPSGECLNVGSLTVAPLVPAANPNRNDLGQLDLIEDPGFDTRDQYGARFAAIQGNTPILPGECP
jgi:hypothetical protein